MYTGDGLSLSVVGLRFRPMSSSVSLSLTTTIQSLKSSCRTSELFIRASCDRDCDTPADVPLPLSRRRACKNRRSDSSAFWPKRRRPCLGLEFTNSELPILLGLHEELADLWAPPAAGVEGVEGKPTRRADKTDKEEACCLLRPRGLELCCCTLTATCSCKGACPCCCCCCCTLAAASSCE
jgi:hypothetical protein